MKVYRYKTVLFGPTSSPFALNGTMKFHLDKFKDHEYSATAMDIKKNLYSDNLMSCKDSEADLITYIKEDSEFYSLNLKIIFKMTQLVLKTD